MLAPPQPVGIHGQTHGTARIPPLQSCFKKNLVQTFFFRLNLDQSGTWNHHGLLQAGGYLPAFNHSRCFTQIFYAAVRAGTNKYPVQLDIGIAILGWSPIYSSARTIPSRLIGSCSCFGSGTKPSTLVTISGDVPQLTWGLMSAPSRSTILSNTASGSLCRVLQCLTAASHCSPTGANGRPFT